MQGRDDLARHGVEHGQRGERPRDLPVLGHVTELFGGFLYSTVVHQLDAVPEGNKIVNTYFKCFIKTERSLQLLLLLLSTRTLMHATDYSATITTFT